MPPNLGGFFMVRSYYPSECHADYFDFERIEALKPAIEACGISTLSQSPMLGFHSLHFHAVHFMRTLPTGSVDPNFGRRVRNRRQLNSLQNTWPYGYSMPIAVRYT